MQTQSLRSVRFIRGEAPVACSTLNFEAGELKLNLQLLRHVPSVLLKSALAMSWVVKEQDSILHINDF
jgi:hypothetical protein